MTATDVLYVRVPVEITDYEFADPGVLQDNAVDAITEWLRRGQAENEAEFGPGAYHLDTHDLTVWTEAALVEDLRDDGEGRSRELDNVRYPVRARPLHGPKFRTPDGKLTVEEVRLVDVPRPKRPGDPKGDGAHLWIHGAHVNEFFRDVESLLAAWPVELEEVK